MNEAVRQAAKQYGFKPYHVYRVATTVPDPKLQNQPVTFLGWKKRAGDVVRASVRLVSTKEEWLIHPSFIVSVLGK